MKLSDLTLDYESHGYGKQLGFGAQPALILIDFAEAYLDPSSPLYAGESAIAAVSVAAHLLTEARSAEIPILHTRVSYTPGGANGGLFYRKVPSLAVFDEGSPLAFPPSVLAPSDDELVITKQYASGFYGTTLASSLATMGIDTLLITGFSTSGCVRATTVDCIQAGYIPCVVSDAVADRDPRPHEQALVDIGAKYGDVVTANEAVQYLHVLVESS